MVKDWKFVKIGELLDFKNGLNKGKDFFGSGTPIINYMDVYKKNGLYRSDIAGKVSLDEKEIERYEVRKGDVFFTRTSETPEEVGLASVLLDDIDSCVFSGFVLRGRPKTDMLLPEYCKYCFSTHEVRQKIIASCTYTTRALTNGTQLSKIEILVPNKEEQFRIAASLTAVDQLIDKFEILIRKYQSLKIACLQHMFPRKGQTKPDARLPGFTGPWEQRKLEDFGEIITGSTPSTNNPEYYSEDGIPWVTPTDILENTISNTSRKLSKEGEKVSRVVPANSILVTCIASIGKNTMLTTKGSFNQQINGIIPDKQNYNPYFLLTESNIWSKEMIAKAAAGTMQIVNKHEFSSIKTMVPSLTEQQYIGALFEKLDYTVTLHQRMCEKYKKIKQGMMEELLSGKIRLI